MRIRSIKFLAIFLILVMLVITLLSFGIFSSSNIKKNIEDQYKNESELVLKQTQSSFEYEFSNIEYWLNQLSQSPILKGNVINEINNIDHYLKTHQKMYQHGNIIYGLNNGGFYQGKTKFVPENYNPLKQKWYTEAVKNNGAVSWTEPYLDFVTQKIIITASKTVRGTNGISGVIAIDFNLEELSNKISTSRIGNKGLVMLLSSNGTIIANRDQYMIGESIFGNQFTSVIKKTNKGLVPYSIQEKEYLLRSATIPQNGMSIMAAINKEEIIQNVIKKHFPIYTVVIFSFLIFSILAYLAVLKAVKPLQKLGALMGDVEKGNYEVVAIINNYQEVSILANGFNSMIKAIKKRDEELIVSNVELKRADEKLRGKYEELKDSQKILKASREKIKRLASYDSLTGLLNRWSLLEGLNQSLENNQGQRLKAIIFIDLDNFKNINDTLGHTFGDKVLVEVAKRLQTISAKEKDVARISGDEFIIVVHDLDSIIKAENVAKEMKRLFEQPFTIESKTWNITASIGVALFPVHAATSEDLLKIADMAMYKAKGSGKNRYRIFDEGVQQEVEEKLKIELSIRECLEQDKLQLFFQPMYNTKNDRITCVEALLRARHVALSPYSPLQIIQTAEETGQIVEIDKWVLREACQTIKKINQNVNQPVHISVNISAFHIMQPDFVENVRNAIVETGVNPAWLDLEITETSLMESFDSIKKKLEKIQKLGISISLDDFGTGYSSLNYLKTLPIDCVKIDKGFVDTMLQSEKDSKIIKSIIKLAHNIGLKVVAEGVEDKKQFELLRDYKIELIQGYYISKPVNYADIMLLIQSIGPPEE